MTPPTTEDTPRWLAAVHRREERKRREAEQRAAAKAARYYAKATLHQLKLRRVRVGDTNERTNK